MPVRQSIISVRNLTKRFEHVTAVNGISFDVEEGEMFAFLGPNGAGKTTTIKMLTTLLRPTAGEIRINGFDPLHEQDAVRRSFGIVFQDPSLDDELTAWENLEFHGVLYGMPRALRRKRMEELLDIVELTERKDDRTGDFSGGMRRRLEIARGLLHHPRILFLDEPTLGLDPQTRNHLWSYAGRLNEQEGITVFFTTHYMQEAERNARRIAVIDRGDIVAQGNVEELRAQTQTGSLEDAFLSLTGHRIREEEAAPIDRMRMGRRMWRR